MLHLSSFSWLVCRVVAYNLLQKFLKGTEESVTLTQHALRARLREKTRVARTENRTALGVVKEQLDHAAKRFHRLKNKAEAVCRNLSSYQSVKQSNTLVRGQV
uniref:Endoplasmic reticulum transmembrane protein n=1 Tax=Chromera velia CCMP2878 TaxID=1169474 RepID=A0A0G4HL93_9ALVE|eukprot:Cvel_28679.t1-p1 / transcript=Cvel_28679.t1 / gene=Cvel_28679 / organism=Chromera_velia_CCMP2878 / gene_product=hypothetical protein / transcript_product=hypothetical protein / location=Cvel_scaffold3802:4367-4672(+) / protein_length=102 / sequence_SO=supercontig / SO=protein_coding / is_pseudo=false